MHTHESAIKTGTLRDDKALIMFIALSVALFLASQALARDRGGFTGPGPELVSVKQALSMRDDSRISLKGKLVKGLGDEAYMFQDDTGSIEVEIDDDDWHGLTVGPDDIVVISGEVDKDWNHISIDVSSIRKQ